MAVQPRTKFQRLGKAQCFFRAVISTQTQVRIQGHPKHKLSCIGKGDKRFKTNLRLTGFQYVSIIQVQLFTRFNMV